MAKGDNSAIIPFVLFAILAAIVGYSIYTGNHKITVKKPEVQAEPDYTKL